MPEQIMLFREARPPEPPPPKAHEAFGPPEALSRFQFENVSRGLHPSGHPLDGSQRCGTCILRNRDGSCATFGPMVHGAGTTVKPSWPSCLKWLAAK